MPLYMALPLLRDVGAAGSLWEGRGDGITLNQTKRHKRQIHALSCSFPSKVMCQRDELSYSFHLVSITDY